MYKMKWVKISILINVEITSKSWKTLKSIENVESSQNKTYWHCKVEICLFCLKYHDVDIGRQGMQLLETFETKKWWKWLKMCPSISWEGLFWLISTMKMIENVPLNLLNISTLFSSSFQLFSIIFKWFYFISTILIPWTGCNKCCTYFKCIHLWSINLHKILIFQHISTYCHFISTILNCCWKRVLWFNTTRFLQTSYWYFNQFRGSNKLKRMNSVHLCWNQC